MGAETFVDENPVYNYIIDAAQRTILFWDVMRERGNAYREHLTETAPHVLDYHVELVADGRKLELKGEAIGTGNRIVGTFVGGTGR